MAVWIFEKLTRSRPLPFVLSVWTSLFVWVKRPPSPRRPCGHPGAGGVVQPLRGVRPPPRRAAPERAAPATGCEADRGSVGTHGAGRRLFQIHLRAGLRSASHRSEEHTSELQSPYDLVCRLLLEKKKKRKKKKQNTTIPLRSKPS